MPDLVQQTWLACVECRSRFRNESSFRTYLLHTARFQLYAYNRRRSKVLPSDLSMVALSQTTAPPDLIDRQRIERTLVEALRRVGILFHVSIGVVMGLSNFAVFLIGADLLLLSDSELNALKQRITLLQPRNLIRGVRRRLPMAANREEGTGSGTRS
jgi:hypothetical protein